MPEKTSFNIAGGAPPVLTLAFPVWLGVYSKGSLAEVEMAQAVQYVLNAATTVRIFSHWFLLQQAANFVLLFNRFSKKTVPESMSPSGAWVVLLQEKTCH